MLAPWWSVPDGEGLAGLGGAVRGGVAGAPAQILQRALRALLWGRRAVVRRLHLVPAESHMTRRERRRRLGPARQKDARRIPTRRRCGRRRGSPPERPGRGSPRRGTPEPSCREERLRGGASGWEEEHLHVIFTVILRGGASGWEEEHLHVIFTVIFIQIIVVFFFNILISHVLPRTSLNYSSSVLASFFLNWIFLMTPENHWPPVTIIIYIFIIIFWSPILR